MSIEAMKQALEALETCMYPQQKQIQAITSLRQAIEQAEKQKPVAWVTDLEFDGETELIPARRKGQLGTDDMDIPLYAQPQREWVGLTLDEIDLLEELYAPPVHPDFVNDASHCLELIRHVEAKLKEKNA